MCKWPTIRNGKKPTVTPMSSVAPCKWADTGWSFNRCRPCGSNVFTARAGASREFFARCDFHYKDERLFPFFARVFSERFLWFRSSYQQCSSLWTVSSCEYGIQPWCNHRLPSVRGNTAIPTLHSSRKITLTFPNLTSTPCWTELGWVSDA